jgi:hypothetical protein
VSGRGLEDRIRNLCAKAIAALGGDELEPALSELKAALREHTERTRRRVQTLHSPITDRRFGCGRAAAIVGVTSPLHSDSRSRFRVHAFLPVDAQEYVLSSQREHNGLCKTEN